MISLIEFILIIGALFQEIRTLPVEEVKELLKNNTLSLAAEETSTPINGSLSLLANELPNSPAEEQLSSSISEASSPTDNEAVSPSVNKILPTLADEKLLSSTQEPQLASSNETLSAADNETLSPSANETLPATDNEALSPSANGILPAADNEAISPSANETLSLSSSSSNGTLSPPLNETLSSASGTLSPAANKTVKLPTIVYGPINQQLGNKYLSTGEGQASEDEPGAVGTQIVYGSTTSQNNNRYMTIGQAEHVYLMVPAINEPLPISVPGLSMLQNISTSGLIFDVNDPMGKRIENLMNTFNAFQQSFDRIMRLASPFLTDNEINPLLRKEAKDDSTRQAKEIKWLTTVASYRMKFIKLYKLLSSTYNQLKLKSKVTTEELDAAKRRKNILVHSEEKLKETTQDLVVYVLSK